MGNHQSSSDAMAAQQQNPQFGLPTVQPVQRPQNPPNDYENGSTASIVFGIILLVFSIIYFIIDVARMAQTGTTFYGPGLWFIGLFILCGILGILAGKKKQLGYIVSVLVLSIIDMLLLIVMSSMLPVDVASVPFTGTITDSSVNSQSYTPYNPYPVLAAYNYMVALIVFGIVGFVAALGASITACVTLCNCCERRVVYVETQGSVSVPPKQGQPNRYDPDPVGQAGPYMQLTNVPGGAGGGRGSYEQPVAWDPNQGRMVMPPPGQRPLQPPPGAAPPCYEDPPEYSYIDEARWSPASAVIPPTSPPTAPPRPLPNIPPGPGGNATANQLRTPEDIDGGYLTVCGSGDYSDVRIPGQ